MWSFVTSFFHLTFIYKFLCGHVFNSLEHIPRSRLAGSCDNQIVFHNSYIILRFHQQSIRDPVFSNAHQHLSLYFEYSHPNGCKMLFCCSFDLYFSDGEWCYLFYAITGHLDNLFRKCLLRSSARLWIGLSFYCWVLRILYIFWI